MKWNEVTWYSRLGAIVVCFGVIPVLTFYIGTQYSSVQEKPDTMPVVTYVSSPSKATLFEFLSPQLNEVLKKNETIRITWTPVAHPEGKVVRLWLYGIDAYGNDGTGVGVGEKIVLIDGAADVVLDDDILMVRNNEYPKYRFVLNIGYDEKQGPGVMGFVTEQTIKGPAFILHSGEDTTAACYRGGCSGQICSDQQGVASTCEYREEYACYQSATCERQANGQCGWTETEQLRMCLTYSGESGYGI
jgi:hypothetical protein